MDLSGFRNLSGQEATKKDTEVPSNIEEYLSSSEFVRLKTDYASIFEQIKERAHLLRGFVTFTFDIPSIGEVILRSLTVKERNFINVAVTPDEQNPSMKAMTKAQILQDQLTLLMCIETLGDLSGTDDWHLTAPDDMSFQKWFDSAPVKHKLEELDKCGSYIEETVMLIIRQMTYAVNMAMAEQLKNLDTPSKPLES